MGNLRRCAVLLLLGWLPLEAVHAQADASEPSREQALQRERERLRQLPLDESLSERLGPTRAQRKQALFDTLPPVPRQQITAFDAELGTPDKLDALQAERIVQLMREVYALQFPAAARSAGRIPTHPQLQALGLLYREIASQEDALRLREVRTDLMLERMLGLLRPRQLRSYLHWEADQLNALRRQIETLRLLAGLPTEIPDAHLPEPRVRTLDEDRGISSIPARA